MSKDIDDVTIEISKAILGEELEKRLPPKIAYRLRAWLKGLRQKANLSDPAVQKTIKEAVAAKMEELHFLQTLTKNEVGVAAYSNGAVKMIFGESVSPKLKKMALDWATKRGLKPVEVSLNKAQGVSEEAIFGGDILDSNCIQRVKFSE